MNKQQMDRDLLGTSSHVVLHSQIPPISQIFYNNVVQRCDNWIAGIIQLRAALLEKAKNG